MALNGAVCADVKPRAGRRLTLRSVNIVCVAPSERFVPSRLRSAIVNLFVLKLQAEVRQRLDVRKQFEEDGVASCCEGGRG